MLTASTKPSGAASRWLRETLGKEWLDEVSMFYERGISLFMQRNQFIHFAYADFEQSRMKYEKCHEIYGRLVKALGECDHSLAFVQYMRFARQAEGMKAARLVFKKAREDPHCSFPAYVAAAQMEYSCSKDKTIAIKIFELGLKKYASELEYCKAYLEFLIPLNEDNNTRVLFERLIGGLSEEKSRELWDIFRRFESSVGDLASTLKVEKRMSQSFGKDIENCEASLILDRYRFLGLWPCSGEELLSMNHKGFARQSKAGAAAHLPRRPSTTRGDTTQAKAVGLANSTGRSMPDITNMLPFRPSTRPGVNVQGVPGGSFSLPQPLTELSLAIPPPTSFQGPFVVVDDWIRLLSKIDVPDDYDRFAAKWEDRVKLDGDLAMKSGSHFMLPKTAARKRNGADAHDSDEEDAAPPVNDLYRVRQQKRVNTAS